MFDTNSHGSVDSLQLAAQLAYDVYMAYACSTIRELASVDSPLYRIASANFHATASVAYPDIRPADLHDYALDSGESLDYVARQIRAERIEDAMSRAGDYSATVDDILDQL